MLQGLNTLKQLRLLSIQSNRIHKIEGLEDCAALEEVYLANNGISKIEGLDANVGNCSHKQRAPIETVVFIDQPQNSGCWV